VLTVKHVTDRGSRRADPGTTRPCHPPGQVQTRTPCRRALTSVELGHHQTARPGQRGLVPPLHTHRHLLPLQPTGSSPQGRTRRWPRTSWTRRSPATAPSPTRCTPTGAPQWHRSRSPRCGSTGRHQVPLPPPGQQRQLPFRAPVQDDEVPVIRLPQLLRHRARRASVL